METLRFLMITSHYPPDHFGGDARFVQYLSNELVRRGHEVHVLYNPAVYAALSGKHVPSRKDDQTEGVVRHRYEHSLSTLGMLSSYSLGMEGPRLDRVRDLVKEHRLDVVHWHNSKGFIERPTAISGPTSLYTAHDFYSICPRSNLLRPGYVACQKARLCQMCLMRWRRPPQLWRLGGRRPFRLEEGITVISPSEYTAKRLGADGVRTSHVLRNFTPDHNQRAGASESRNIILYAGLLEKFKGPQTLLKAFNRTKDAHEFELWIVGDGSIRRALEDQVDRLGIRERVHIPGFVQPDSLKTLMEKTAATVIPSECFENSPLIGLESFSMGIPVVGANIGGLPEIIGQESGSMLFESGNEIALGDCIVSMWSNRDKLEVQGRKARNYYLAEHSPEVHTGRYINIIRSANR